MSIPASTGAHPDADPSSARPIARNAASLLLAYVAPRILTFLAAVAAARALGTSEFGAYGMAAAFAVILSIVATLGMVPLLVREFAQTPGRAATLLSAANRLKTITNTVMLVSLVLLGRGVGYSGQVFWAALLLGVASAIAAYADNLAAYYQAVERMHVWTQASALFGLVTGVAGAATVIATSNIVAFSAAPILGQAASLAWLRHRLPDGMRRAPARAADVRRLFMALVPFAAAFVALTVYAKLDILLLSHWWPKAEVGLYAAAYKFVDITRAVATVGAAAVYPRLARVGASAGVDMRAAASRLVELALLVSVPAASLLVLLRAPVIHVVFGAQYHDAASALAYLGAALPALTVNLVAVHVLAAAHAMHRVAQLYGVTLVLNLALNVLLTPARGADGAALSMLISEWSLAAGTLLTARTRLGIRLRPRAMWAVGATAAACAGIAAWDGLAPEGTAGVFLLAFGIVYGVGAPLDETERAALLGALRRDAGP